MPSGERETVRAIIARLLAQPVEKCADHARLDNLGADSLDVIELAMEVEGEYNCALSDDELARVATVGDFLAVALAALGGSVDADR